LDIPETMEIYVQTDQIGNDRLSPQIILSSEKKKIQYGVKSPNKIDNSSGKNEIKNFINGFKEFPDKFKRDLKSEIMKEITELTKTQSESYTNPDIFKRKDPSSSTENIT